MSLIVQKFGGSSVANAERVMNVAKIVTETYAKGNDVVVVVSAQGDTTDDLIAKAEEINPNGSKREKDMLLAAGEQISISLLAMAIEKLGYLLYHFLVGRQVLKQPTFTQVQESKRLTQAVSVMNLTKRELLLLPVSRVLLKQTILQLSAEAVPIQAP